LLRRCLAKQKPGVWPGKQVAVFRGSPLLLVVWRECFWDATCETNSARAIFQVGDSRSVTAAPQAIQGDQFDDAPEQRAADGEYGMGESAANETAHGWCLNGE
jgi:hypothetical protein